MSAGISGSYTVFSAATIESVSVRSSTGVICEGGALRLSCGGAASLCTSFIYAATFLDKQLLCPFQSIRERIDFSERIVEGERRPASRGHAKPLHERHGAMRPRPNRHARTVDQRRHIVGMRALHRERQDRALTVCRADDPQRVDPGEALMGICAQRLLMRAN